MRGEALGLELGAMLGEKHWQPIVAIDRHALIDSARLESRVWGPFADPRKLAADAFRALPSLVDRPATSLRHEWATLRNSRASWRPPPRVHCQWPGAWPN